MQRRTFIRLSTGASVGLGLGVAQAKSAALPTRPLGQTGERVSLLCLGGYHIGQAHLSEEESLRLMHAAIDGGINFFDNAWEYNNGRSEELMGRALQGARRQRVLLMSKHLGRDPATALRQLEDSLRRLRTDCIDLWQFHSIRTPADVNSIYESGALEIARQAREQGKVRFIGFTGHYRPDRHLEMLAGDFAWDAVQMPLSPFDYHYESFARRVLPELNRRGLGSIAMKTMGGEDGVFLRSGALQAPELLRYALSLPVSSVCVGMDRMETLEANMAIARDFVPMDASEMDALRARCLPLADGGTIEHYKGG
jgi:aryl-alcohol dehydrogenase-like predicted oxidoreductase